MADADRCESCAAPLGKSFDRTCARCGWDNMVKMRKCVKCKGGALSIHDTIGYGPISGVVGIGGFLALRVTGSLFGWAGLCALGCLCGLITMATLGYKCGACGARANSRLLSGEEKKAKALRRVGYLIGSVLFAVAAGVLALLSLGRF